MKNTEMEIFFNGEKLYGDDFNNEQILQWYNDDKQTYSNLLPKKYKYLYNLVNEETIYRFLPKKQRFKNALGFGAAEGFELLPIADRIENITIIDAADEFENNIIADKKISRFKPNSSGKLPFEDNSFDLITCFHVLHHIPNVSFVISELYRCLAPNGLLLLREPINSMGDWRDLRPGLTKCERGIPLDLFRKMVSADNIIIEKEHLYCFRVLQSLPNYQTLFTKSRMFLKLDSMLCKLTKWNYKYHPNNKFRRIRPLCVSFVLKKYEQK